MMNRAQEQMPLYQALQHYRAYAPARLHMPGHKGGLGLPEPLRSDWQRFAELDITEIPESDDLFEPWGPLRESQLLLAELYGAEQSFYLVNGASVGLIAALLALMPQNGIPRKVLLPKQAHRSLWNACILADLWPVSAALEIDRTTALPLPPSLEALQAVLIAEPGIKAAVLLHPSYHGLCGELAAQVELLHRYDLPVIVDEAHGTHLRFLPQPIPDALQVGADVVVQSPHKTAASLTQTAWMHCQGQRIDSERVRASLRVLHSSSPSFPFMVSLEAARRQLALSGKQDWAKLCEHLALLRSIITHLPGLAVLNFDGFQGRVAALDPAKLYLRTRKIGMNGYAAAAKLRLLGVSSEMADVDGVLWMHTPGDDETVFSTLARAARALSDTREDALPELDARFAPPALKRLLSPREAWAAPRRDLTLDASVGEVAAEMITPYPPGVPLVTPGEQINNEMVALIRELLLQGARVTGIDLTTQQIKVVHS